MNYFRQNNVTFVVIPNGMPHSLTHCIKDRE